ncbi:MAG: methyl-accepting chemotaxis protein [Shewanella sp.]
MTIANRIILACMLMCSLGILAAGGIVSWRNYVQSEDAITNRASEQLLSIREIKKEEIEAYFATIASQVTTMASSPMIQEAMKGFSQSFADFGQQAYGNYDNQVSSLTAYYDNDFSQQYRKLNQDHDSNASAKLTQLSDNAKLVQTAYIASNTNPLGEKNKLNATNDDTDYTKFHTKYHPNINEFLQAFGYYDVFLVDREGNVVYSVFKELDFATNLVSGPYADSGLGKVFKRALAEPGKVVLEDFAKYYPSYENAASFIATEIHDASGAIGVLIFQMPVDYINGIMTFHQHWKNSGLGDSGQVYLVGADGLLRSQNRFLLENKDSYLQAMRQSNASADTIANLSAKNTAIGIQAVDTPSARRALKGENGVEIIKDFRNNNVISAFGTMHVLGLEWAILSEIDEAEAVQDLQQLKTSTYQTLALVCLVLLLVALVVGTIIGRSIAGPIVATIDKISLISANKDLSTRLDTNTGGELGKLSHGLNQFFSEIQSLLGQSDNTSKNIFKHSSLIVQDMKTARSTTEQQSAIASTVVHSIDKLTTSVESVAMSAEQAATDVNIANNKCKQTAVVAQDLGDEMDSLTSRMSQVTLSINNLEQESLSIASVLDVIQSIAEQTNLLALNAAIEAARAGEQGRGFAVVADEVRTLASRTQSSTEEIRKKIERLQNETQNVVQQVGTVSAMAAKGKTACVTNGEMLGDIVSMIEKLNAMNLQIASSAKQQALQTKEIGLSCHNISLSADDIANKTKTSEGLSSALEVEANLLTKQLSNFRF